MTHDRISVKLPAELAKRLEATASERIVSPSIIVQRALEHFLPRLPDIDSEEPERSDVTPPTP